MPQQPEIDLRTANQFVLTGVRFTAILLGLDRDDLLYRFIVQEAESWLADPTGLSVHMRAHLMGEGVAAPARTLASEPERKPKRRRHQ